MIDCKKNLPNYLNFSPSFTTTSTTPSFRYTYQSNEASTVLIDDDNLECKERFQNVFLWKY